MTTMKAAVIREAGGPHVLKVEDRQVPFTRRGSRRRFSSRESSASRQSTRWQTPLAASSKRAPSSRQRWVAWGDGSCGYAKYICVPAGQVQRVESSFPGKFGRSPGNAANRLGSLFRALRLTAGKTLLVRGGTTSVGLAGRGQADQRERLCASQHRRHRSVHPDRGGR
jgi:hypothetical protein